MRKSDYTKETRNRVKGLVGKSDLEVEEYIARESLLNLLKQVK